MRKHILSVAVLLCLVVGLTATSFAWFTASNAITFPESFGATDATAYFAGGDGTADDPYQISNAVHLYNLAWLQYLGYFNMSDGFNNNVAQNYFILTADIDMGSLTIPPIGTEKYPFVGNFDGNGKVISSLTVSNAESDFTQRPSNAVFAQNGVLQTVKDGSDVSVVGFFGVIGNYQDYITNTSDTEGTYGETNTIIKAKMEAKNFYVQDMCVKTYAQQTLVGLVAGFVGGNVSNTGVYKCHFQLNPGSTGIGDYGTTVSKYSIVGDYDSTIVKWEELDKVINSAAGNEATWGGSIDMRTLNRRLTYMVAKVGNVSGWTTTATDTDLGINTYRGSKAEHYWNANSTSYSVIYLDDGTVLPLNVDKAAMGLDKSDETTVSNGSTAGFHINDYYANNVSEIVSSNNTGYIVGGGKTNNGYIPSRVQPLASAQSEYERGIYKSLGYTSNQGATMYNAANFEMLTLGSDGKWYRIKDEINSGITNSALSSHTQKSYTELGLASSGAIYKGVREAFDASMEGAYMVHGFHFMSKINEKKYEVIETDNVQIYGLSLNKNEKYQFIKGGINFTVSEDGVIKTIVGSFYGQPKNSLFDLYKVVRNRGTITEVIRILNIYKKDSDGTIHYNLEGDTAGYTKVFSFENLTQACLETGVAYYFEIPVTAGDYVIGANMAVNSNESSNNTTAYLMYLDIGANGGDDGEVEAPGTTQVAYTISAVDFVSPEGTGDEVSISTGADHAPIFPAYDDVVFEIKDCTAASQIWFKRKNWESGANPISTEVLWWKEGTVQIVPTPAKLADENENAGTSRGG